MTTRPTAKENAKRFASVIQALQACEAACTHCATEFGKNGHAEAMARCIGVSTAAPVPRPAAPAWTPA